jgi:hypothetical protein
MARKTKMWPRISEALRYFFVGTITAISGTDIIPEVTAKYSVFALGLVILGLKSIDMGVSEKPRSQPKQENETA